ncbi:TadE/TadG family type IV pilus assembly protein [Novosphingobium aquiterrae]|uniref:TadE/TadG family type IV pilus assembly protein n=1 Tax=Novosphingobium aquiterrae TaxID=624388 RepID=A0ABV6PKN3_9SPHN
MARLRTKSFLTDQRGAVAATYALALTGLVVIGGVGFDYGRMMAMDSELQNGADQAALAGATQLDGKSAVGLTPGACARAAAAAINLVTNKTLLAQSGQTISVASEAACDATGSVRFWQDKAHSVAATSDATAKFIELDVDVRTVKFLFTPLTGLLVSPNIKAGAMAGLGSSICKVPPLMICSPDPAQSFNAAGRIGWGIQATGHGNNSWAAGDFGFLSVGSGQKADLEKALAFASTTFDCTPVDGAKPEPGNAQGLFAAINTRFDIYDTNGNPLGDCNTGSCPSASNVIKDMVNASNAPVAGANSCKTQNQGWQLPTMQFSPKARNAGTETALTQHDSDSQIDAMGLTRDLCHYASYVNGVAANKCHNLNGLTTDTSDRFGTGNWARGDYFNKYHSGRIPGNASTMTRYETYKWELANGYNAAGGGIDGTSAGGSNKQYASPRCSTGSAGSVDRRVLTVAIVKNCSSLSGNSTPVSVDEWVDVFLVEPVVDARGNGVIADSVYLEVIGPSKLGGGGSTSSQLIRRDVPYLVH